MKSIICIALVMTLAFSSKVALTKSQHMAVLAQIDAHPLGEAILAQVSLTMSAQGTIHQVVDMTEGILVELHETQAECDAAHLQATSTCDRLVPEYETKKKLHEDARDLAKKTTIDTEDLLKDAQEVQLFNTENELKSVLDRIAAGQAQRDTEHAAWTELDQEHADGISACQDAVNLLASMGRGALFIQLQGRIKSVTKRLEDMTHLNDKFTAYQPLVQSFSQIASSSSHPELLAQITKLISTLKQQITATRAADQGWEDRKQNAWDHELNDLTNQKNSLSQRRNALNDQIENYNHIISENRDKTDFHSEEADKFHYMHQQQKQWCEDELMVYNEETQYRVKEGEIIAKLKEYLQSRTAETEEFIMMKQTTD